VPDGIVTLGGLEANTDRLSELYMPTRDMERTLSDIHSSQCDFHQYMVKIAYCAYAYHDACPSTRTLLYWHDNVTVWKELYFPLVSRRQLSFICDGHVEFSAATEIAQRGFRATPDEDTQNTTASNPYKTCFDLLFGATRVETDWPRRTNY